MSTGKELLYLQLYYAVEKTSIRDKSGAVEEKSPTHDQAKEHKQGPDEGRIQIKVLADAAADASQPAVIPRPVQTFDIFRHSIPPGYRGIVGKFEE